jgi:hypothetical protein
MQELSRENALIVFFETKNKIIKKDFTFQKTKTKFNNLTIKEYSMKKEIKSTATETIASSVETSASQKPFLSLTEKHKKTIDLAKQVPGITENNWDAKTTLEALRDNSHLLPFVSSFDIIKWGDSSDNEPVDKIIVKTPLYEEWVAIAQEFGKKMFIPQTCLLEIQKTINYISDVLHNPMDYSAITLYPHEEESNLMLIVRKESLSETQMTDLIFGMNYLFNVKEIKIIRGEVPDKGQIMVKSRVILIVEKDNHERMVEISNNFLSPLKGKDWSSGYLWVATKEMMREEEKALAYIKEEERKREEKTREEEKVKRTEEINSFIESNSGFDVKTFHSFGKVFECVRQENCSVVFFKEIGLYATVKKENFKEFIDNIEKSSTFEGKKGTIHQRGEFVKLYQI